MWYQNICSALFGFVTKHASDGQTDGGQSYESIAAGAVKALESQVVMGKTDGRSTIRNATSCGRDCIIIFYSFIYILLLLYLLTWCTTNCSWRGVTSSNQELDAAYDQDEVVYMY